jgi:hypothetical protein
VETTVEILSAQAVGSQAQLIIADVHGCSSTKVEKTSECNYLKGKATQIAQAQRFSGSIK